MGTYQGIMLTKSPFFLVEEGSAGFSSSLELRVWNGALSGEPASSTYTLTKETLSASDTEVTYEISKFINDSFDHGNNSYETEVTTAKTDGYWVNVKSFDGDTNRDDTWLATDGYSDFLEGINYQPPESVGTLLSTGIIYQHPDIPIRIPAYTDNVSSGDTAYSILAYPLAGGAPYIEFFQRPLSSTQSYARLAYVSVSGTPFGTIYVRDGNSNTMETLEVKQLNCSVIHTPYVCTFINKYGAYEELIFSLASRETSSFNSKSYNNQLLELDGGVPTYNTSKHQKKRYNVQEKKSITLNTDWIEEESNETIRQILGSDNVWLTADGTTFPVVVKTESLIYKKNSLDGLIQYSIDFEYAFNIRNTIY